MRLALLSVTLSLALPGQPSPQSGQKCSIEGNVASAASGEPVSKANVVARRSDRTSSNGDLSAGYSTVTDPAGHFILQDLDPGKYRLSVSRNGFVNAEYGARGPLRPGTILSLDPGKQMQDVNFRLTPHGVITGRVLDEDGEPLAYARIDAMRYRYSPNGRQLIPLGNATSNDLGEYRIFGIAPGKYFLSASARTNAMLNEASVDRSAGPHADEEYVATYYPGTTEASSAAPVDVSPGGQLRGIDFRLSKAHTVRVRGRVNNISGSGRNVSVFLIPRDRVAAFNPNRAMVRDPQGNFEIRGVAPGVYTLLALVFDADRGVSARQSLTVSSSNVENVTLTLAAGLELTGRFRVEGEAAPSLSAVRLQFQPYEQGGMILGAVPNLRMKDDGTFSASNIMPDRYSLYALSLPDGYFVKSIRIGSEDVTDAALDLTSGASGPLDILLSPGAGQMDGTVLSPRQEPAPGATVVLIPQLQTRRERFQFYKVITTDQYGHFSFKNIDPGEYKAFAWEDIESNAYMDPEVVKPVESRGQAVTVHENGREKLQLDLIPADAAISQTQ